MSISSTMQFWKYQNRSAQRSILPLDGIAASRQSCSLPAESLGRVSSKIDPVVEPIG
jgi:hypothetical protein